MQTSLEWRKYYEENACSLLKIPWELGHELSYAEQRAIIRSVQDFQAGESSEGRHLFQYAKDYAERTDDHEYIEAIRLFIAEEQRHARDLGYFMQLSGIPLVKTTFTDGVFRRLRQFLGGLEISIGVLVTAEIIAKVYYAALQSATNSVVLQTLCRQILRDEVKHVEFQVERLGILRAKRSWLLLKGTMAIQRFLFLGTCIVVWAFHSKVFRKSGYDFGDFWWANWMEFEEAFQMAQDVSDEIKASENLVGLQHNFDRE
jgi:hypothetical protein